PARLEDIAVRHPGIATAAAFPVADKRLGERACLAVVTHDAAPLDPELLRRHLDQAGLSRAEMPEFVLQLERMPLTASGKIVKRDLVAAVAEGRMTPLPLVWPAAAATGD